MPTFSRIISSHLITKKKKKNPKGRNNKKKAKKTPITQNPSPKTVADEAAAVETNAEEAEEEEEEERKEEEGGFKLKSSVSSHSHAIQPLGNLLLRDPFSNVCDHGLGTLRALSDELVLDVLSLLGGRDLACLAAASKSLYVFSSHEPLWRNLVLGELKGDFFFTGSWRSTYISASSSRLISPNSCSGDGLGPGISIRDFYSDYLFQSWLCASLEMKPQWLQTDNIQRRRGISLEEFISCFEEPNKPVLLEGCLDGWPAVKKWDRDNMVRMCKGAKFAVGPVEMKLEDYFQYADTVREERPLYLFDPKFAEKVPEMCLDYEVPVYFREDLFSVLGEERPDYRWIIMGPVGSGSSFHVDPNSTSAWNAVIRGSKKWVMFPPEVVPPGVHPSPDGAEVMCPVSIIEWFMNFYDECKNWKRRPVECVCREGEIIFVPNGWWHLVINLEDSIAITQNYISRRNLLNVLDFLRRPNASELVSGTKDKANLYEKFRCALESSYPGTIHQLMKKAKEKVAKQKLTFWESVADANTGGFKFSFRPI